MAATGKNQVLHIETGISLILPFITACRLSESSRKNYKLKSVTLTLISKECEGASGKLRKSIIKPSQATHKLEGWNLRMEV